MKLAPGLGGVALDAFRGAEQEHGDLEPGAGKQARGHHAVAAVVAAAAEDGDAARARELASGEVGDRRAGVAHELQRWNAVLLAGGAVAGLHLGGGEDVHRNMVDESGARVRDCGPK